MKLLYLSADNLRNTPFVKELVYHYKNVGKSILLHDHFGSVADTRFVTKRISALMSEEMITNNAFSGDMRSIFQATGAGTEVRIDFLSDALKTVDLLVLNPLGLEGSIVVKLDPLEVARQLRKAMSVEVIHIFPKNSRSPLVATPKLFTQVQQTQPLRLAFEEETQVLDTAEALLPAIVAAPANFMLIDA